MSELNYWTCPRCLLQNIVWEEGGVCKHCKADRGWILEIKNSKDMPNAHYNTNNTMVGCGTIEGFNFPPPTEPTYSVSINGTSIQPWATEGVVEINTDELKNIEDEVRKQVDDWSDERAAVAYLYLYNSGRMSVDRALAILNKTR